MPNPYFNNTLDLVAGTKARASDVEANFTAVSDGMDLVYADVQTLQSAVGGGLTSQETDIASATTTTIGAGGNILRITGNTTIASFGTSYTGVKFLRFAGSLVLQNSSSLVLPGGTNITTTAGDTCIAVPIGNPASGWRVEDYRRMSLPLIEDDALRLAAAASTYLSQANAATTYQTITGDQNSSTQLISSVTGTDTITGNVTPALTAYASGQTFRFVAAGANTGAVTININGLGAKSVTKNGTTALDAGDIASGALVQVSYDGTRFQLVSGAGGGGAVGGGVIYENKRTLNTDLTMSSAKSGHMIGPLTVATGKTLTVPTGEALMIFNPSTSGTGTNDVLTTGAQTFQGQKTFAQFPNIAALPSMVRLNTDAGFGSTNTAIRRFTNVVTNQGSDITYADSAANGASFTINTSGVYAMSYANAWSAAGDHGFSLNSSQLTTGIPSITAADCLNHTVTSGAGQLYAVSWIGYLQAGSVVRPHCLPSGTVSTSNGVAQFTITRVA